MNWKSFLTCVICAAMFIFVSLGFVYCFVSRPELDNNLSISTVSFKGEPIKFISINQWVCPDGTIERTVIYKYREDGKEKIDTMIVEKVKLGNCTWAKLQ